MRALAAILLASAAADWPGLVLDRAGVALLGLAAIALSLPAGARRRGRALEVPRRPAIGGEPDEPELDADAARALILSFGDKHGRPA